MKTPRHGKHAAKQLPRRPKPRKGTRQRQFITRAEARRRAAQHLQGMLKGADVRDGKTMQSCGYEFSRKLAGKEVWLVYANLGLPAIELRSSQIIAVCKRTGRVLYEGSAHDEG
jgi:hypothetical protein